MVDICAFDESNYGLHKYLQLIEGGHRMVAWNDEIIKPQELLYKPTRWVVEGMMGCGNPRGVGIKSFLGGFYKRFYGLWKPHEPYTIVIVELSKVQNFKFQNF